MNLKKASCAFLMAAASLCAQADEASVKRALFEKYKNLPPAIAVNKTPIAGLYEVNIFGRAAYTNEKVDYLLMGGNLINLSTLEDESKKRAPFLHSEFVANLPVDLAIKTVYGKGERKFITFEDPDCGFCRNMNLAMQANPERVNATVYTFMFPLSIHPDSGRKAKWIMCQAQPSETWKNWMGKKTGVPVDGEGNLKTDEKACEKGEKAVAAGERIARTMGFNSTPRMLMPSGQTESGDPQGVERINELLEQSAAEMQKIDSQRKALGQSGASKGKP